MAKDQSGNMRKTRAAFQSRYQGWERRLSLANDPKVRATGLKQLTGKNAEPASTQNNRTSGDRSNVPDERKQFCKKRVLFSNEHVIDVSQGDPDEIRSRVLNLLDEFACIAQSIDANAIMTRLTQSRLQVN